ncbi:MAG TPA: tail fiber protein [Pyrinomonadaceae bacterium]|jgi:microcystin-dependent protein
MASPFLGEIRLMTFDFAPENWAACDGQLMSISQHQALYSIVGTTYGGDGVNTFALPDLRGRAPIHIDSFILGQKGGEEFHTLSQDEMPTHRHSASAATVTGTQPVGMGAYLASSSILEVYAASENLTPLTPSTITSVGGSQSHENRQPYLVLNFVIALTGIFPEA